MSSARRGDTATVVVLGATGAMGQFACALLEESSEFDLVGRLGRKDDVADWLATERPELGLDFTVAGLGAEHGRLLLEHGVRPVVGTSGVTEAELQELDHSARSRGLGGLVVPNFSIGAVLQGLIAARLATEFAAVEIFEEHHPAKRDAPSGTALHTRAGIARAKNCAVSEVTIHSSRLPGVLANQRVVFGTQGETLELIHRTLDRSAYAPGILRALKWVQSAEGVSVGLEQCLETPRL